MPQTTEQRAGEPAPTAAHPLPDPTAAALEAPEGARRTGSGAVVPVLAFAGIVVAVMQTMLVPVIKDLPTLLATAPSNATWVMTATLLTGAVATPIMGRLGDLYGKRRMLLTSLAFMVLGSLICGFTVDMTTMLVGRALQGFAMGAIPLGIGIMRDELPRERLGSAMALMSSSIGVGGGLALPAASLVAQQADWHALFFGAAGLGVLAMLLSVALVPETSVRATGRFDVLGAIGLTGGLVCLLLPITKGSDWGWGSSTTLGLFGGAVALLLLWGLYELRVAAPLVDLRTTARREVLLTNLTSIMVGVAFYAISLVLPQLLQLPASTGYGLGQSMVVAGLCVAPLGLTMMLTAPVYARISARRGPKATLMLGMLIIAVGYGTGLGLMSAAWQTVIISVIVGAGIGLAYSSLPALIVGAVDPSETSAANGLNTLMRSIGTSVSSAVIGMVLAHMSAPAGAVSVPTMAGFRTSFAIATGAVAVGLVLAAFLPSQRAASRPQLLARGGEESGSFELVAPGGDGEGSASDGEKVSASGGEKGSASEGEKGSAPGSGRRTDSASATTPASIHVTAPRPGSHRIHGTLLGGIDGTPLHGGRVVLTDTHGAVVATTTADAQGSWELTGLMPGGFTLVLSATGHRPLARSLMSPGTPARQDARLAPAAAVRGTVRDPHGRPLPDAAVTLQDQGGSPAVHTVTGPDGTFAFTGLAGGAYTLTAAGYPPHADRVTLAAGDRERRLDLDLTHEAARRPLP
ncbi:MFS transporter [Streptomyces chrestomyceticus JCM 4735]|uniref:alpha-amylase n=1 Tax=Streptomyces chrestomyceticus JCM 4735 TaxID=1306181 RepID=A0A7U9KXN6_9ACTN|nr:MFS transporter [Streptomyces chrestomyceticus]GCD36528.1 MFS transporter [Streptomyces chrestomyceticus JCM 4735]